jgi:hypothetical protein
MHGRLILALHGWRAGGLPSACGAALHLGNRPAKERWAGKNWALGISAWLLALPSMKDSSASCMLKPA